MTIFKEHDRVRLNGANDKLEGTITGDHDTMFQHMVGVRWDGNDFAFVDPAKLVHVDAIVHNGSDTGTNTPDWKAPTDPRVEPEPPAGNHIEILARFIDEAHIDHVASTEWRGLWCRPVKLTGYSSCRDVHGNVLQQTLRFGDGTQYTSQNPHLKVRVWV